jgi:hypothetical protein
MVSTMSAKKVTKKLAARRRKVRARHASRPVWWLEEKLMQALNSAARKSKNLHTDKRVMLLKKELQKAKHRRDQAAERRYA